MKNPLLQYSFFFQHRVADCGGSWRERARDARISNRLDRGGLAKLRLPIQGFRLFRTQEKS